VLGEEAILAEHLSRKTSRQDSMWRSGDRKTRRQVGILEELEQRWGISRGESTPQQLYTSQKFDCEIEGEEACTVSMTALSRDEELH
jgi:hypothetical protein